MGLLGKLFGSSKPRLETPEDDPEAKRLRAAQQKNDWRTVQDFFAQTANPYEREFFVEQLSSWKRRPPFFDAWVAASPNCAEAWLLRGAHGIQWAWEARSGTSAENVPEEAWPIFFERLKQAWADLNHAVELNAQDHTAFVHLIRCAMGLQLEKEVAYGCLNQTIERSVFSWSAHAAVLWFICKKWYGSHEEMFEFVRTVSAAAPEGHGLHALIPIAHHERWLYAAAFDKDEEFTDKYYDQPEVQAEILAAYNKSLGSPQHHLTRATRNQSSFFAAGLLRCGAFKQAQTELDRLGDLVPEYPWAQFGDPVDRFVRAKEIVKANLK